MTTEKIAVPIKAPANFISKQASSTIKELKGFMKGEASRVLKGDLERTTSNWTHKPQMVAEYSEPYHVNMQVHAHPKGRYTLQWQRISGGTKAREIVSTKGVMVFRRDYAPKTTLQGVYGGSGARSGDLIHARIVGRKKKHRIEPREFSKKIVAKRERELVSKMENIVNRSWKY